MDFKAIALQSGSSGNCIYVETPHVRLLFDAGLSCIDMERRLASRGRSAREVDALIISHDHADHVRHAGVLHRKYGMPLYITRDTLDAAIARHRLGRLDDVRYFYAGDDIHFSGVHVRTIPTPHDGVDGVIFTIDYKGKRLGIMTDLGHVFEGLHSEIAGLDAVFLESNYDPNMLAYGPYPRFLKRRIQGPRGHISNPEAAELLQSAKKLKWACLSHLSQHNNYPNLAIMTHKAVLPSSLTLHVAHRNRSTEVLTV
ncbi:MAG TPA: MBL fold metallo-hydrolase [Dissulfurispiraceae bacterium]|nr:MBL fold metallo-hydrolase [Dissulfurispiraceae bacterium]